MNTSTTETSPTPFPYHVPNAAEAASLFFLEHVKVVDPKMSNSGSTPEMHQRICDIVASLISDRLRVFWEHKAYGENEEIEFAFKPLETGSRTFKLVSPAPLVKDLEYRFRNVGVYVKDYSLYGFATSGNGYMLRVSPRLVTFGGVVVWQAAGK